MREGERKRGECAETTKKKLRQGNGAKREIGKREIRDDKRTCGLKGNEREPKIEQGNCHRIIRKVLQRLRDQESVCNERWLK